MISIIEWIAIAAVGFLDVILSHTTGISMSVPANTAEAIAIIISIWPLTALVTRLTGFAQGSEVLAENASKFFVFIIVVSGLEYYLATNQAPLNDATLVRVDGLLGFYWPDFFNWVTAHKSIGHLLSYAYNSLNVQAMFVLFAVAILYPHRANRFVTAFLISAFFTLLLFGLYPVAGPFVFFQHTNLPEARYTEHYLQMRSHALAAIPINDIRGIVSFPSFHVSSAVIITYFCRGLSFLSVLILIINIVMSVAALVVGGHYLTDVFAGFLIGFVTIGIIHAMQGPGPEPRLSWNK